MASKNSKLPAAPAAEKSLQVLNDEIISCRRCPRLVEYRERIAKTKRRAYREHEYWGRPVPGFGDPHAKLLIIGLAPGAHGSNRTGRPFTGDASGVFLYRALFRAGFANQPTSVAIGDGLELRNAYINAVIRCAPPDNKPLPAEIMNCRDYFDADLQILKPRAILALGRLAWDQYLRSLVREKKITTPRAFPFAHGATYSLPHGLPRIFASYHPSQQNTQTGKLTEAMFANVLRDVRSYLKKKNRD
ncbi:MAG TPA: uracil-DNA glycosylase [Candidatus Acidoferrales bacterium]|nr:uracil-DNA glycosylase [Candidatus Acidoferrales bacterium]